MNSAETQQALFWLADNMHVWVPGVASILLGFIIGITYLVDIARRDGS